jgi:hypothetical protein
MANFTLGVPESTGLRVLYNPLSGLLFQTIDANGNWTTQHQLKTSLLENDKGFITSADLNDINAVLDSLPVEFLSGLTSGQYNVLTGGLNNLWSLDETGNYKLNITVNDLPAYLQDTSASANNISNLSSYVTGVVNGMGVKIAHPIYTVLNSLSELEELAAKGEVDKEAIYLVPSDKDSGTHDEYLCVLDDATNSWKLEQIGNTKVDLSDYAKTSDLSAYVLNTDIKEIAKTGSYDDLTDKPAFISGVTVNNAVVSPVNKVVNIDLSDYAKSSDLFSGSYDDLTDKPAFISGITINNSITTLTGNIVNIDLSSYVKKDGNKVLSENDFTTTLKSKLDGIAAGAEVNVISGITVNNAKISPVNKVVNIDLTSYAKSSDLNNYVLNSDIKTVAKTGSYTDLTDKPIVVDALEKSTNPTTDLVAVSAIKDYANKVNSLPVAFLSGLTPQQYNVITGGLNNLWSLDETGKYKLNIAVSDLPEYLQELTPDDISSLSAYVTGVVNDMGVKIIHPVYEVVSSFATLKNWCENKQVVDSSGNAGWILNTETIYLVPSEKDPGTHDEYLCMPNTNNGVVTGWTLEQIGNTKVDLSGYATLGQISSFITSGDVISRALAADKLSTERKIALTGAVVGSVDFDGTNNVTINTVLGSGFTIDASKIDGLTVDFNDLLNIPSGEIENKIDAIKYNNTTFGITDKTVDLSNLSSFFQAKGNYQLAGDYVLNSDIKTVAKTGSYTDLTDKPTSLSSFTNDAGYITLNSIAISGVTVNNTPVSPVNKVVNIDLSNYAKSSDLSNYVLSTDLSKVAKTGSYTDLTDKPAIPTKVSNLTNDKNYLASKIVSGNYVPNTQLSDIFGSPASQNTTELKVVVPQNVIDGSANKNGIAAIWDAANKEWVSLSQSSTNIIDETNAELLPTVSAVIDYVAEHTSPAGPTYTEGTGISLTNNVISIKAATGNTLGGVKSGGNISINANGEVTVLQANKVKSNLTINGKTYNGSSAISVTAVSGVADNSLEIDSTKSKLKVKISATADNQLSLNSDGLYVKLPEVDPGSSANIVVGEWDGKQPDITSEDTGLYFDRDAEIPWIYDGEKWFDLSVPPILSSAIEEGVVEPLYIASVGSVISYVNNKFSAKTLSYFSDEPSGNAKNYYVDCIPTVSAVIEYTNGKLSGINLLPGLSGDILTNGIGIAISQVSGNALTINDDGLYVEQSSGGGSGNYSAGQGLYLIKDDPTTMSSFCIDISIDSIDSLPGVPQIATFTGETTEDGGYSSLFVPASVVSLSDLSADKTPYKNMIAVSGNNTAIYLDGTASGKQLGIPVVDNINPNETDISETVPTVEAVINYVGSNAGGGNSGGSGNATAGVSSLIFTLPNLMENESAKLAITDLYDDSISDIILSAKAGEILDNPEIAGAFSGSIFSKLTLKVPVTGALKGLSDYRYQWIISNGTNEISGLYAYGSVYGQQVPASVTADDVIFNENSGIYSGSTLTQVTNDLYSKVFGTRNYVNSITFESNTCNEISGAFTGSAGINFNIPSGVSNATCIFQTTSNWTGNTTVTYEGDMFINKPFEVQQNKQAMYIVNIDKNIITWTLLEPIR